MATRKQLASLKALAQRAVDAGDEVTGLETRGVLATQKISSSLLSNSYRTVGEVAETVLVNADELLGIKGLGEGRIHTLLSVALASVGGPTETGMRQIPDIDLEKPVFSDEARLWHNAFIGKTGSGKTYAARGEIEDIIEAGGQVIIIDPTGAWSGLRMRPDGSPSGYDIAIFGGQYGDRPLVPDMASALGRIAGRTRRSMILDLSGISLEIEDQREIVHEFLKSLYRINRKPIHLVIDEADEFCLSEDTEILTKEGWKTYDQVKEGTLVSCFDLETEEYSYHPIKRHIVMDYKGEMVSLKTRSLDCLATPDHRIVLRREQRANGRRKKYPWVFEAACNVPHQIDIPLGGAPVGDGIDDLSLEDFRIIGWILTDGSVHDKRAKKPSYCLSQALGTVKNGVPMQSEMESVLSDKEGISSYTRTRSVHAGIASNAITTEKRWYFNVKSSSKYSKYLGHAADRIPRQILQNANLDQLQELYRGMVEGDGTYSHDSWKTLYCGHNKCLADEFQELCLKLGIRASTSLPKASGQWNVRIGKRKFHYVRKPKTEKYDGKVWDITVPTGAFVARRNGKAFVTGNCPQDLEKDTRALRSTVARIMARGRSLGFRCTLITQRPAKIDKNSISQVESMAVLRVTAPQDRKSITEWFDDKGGEGSHEVLTGLGSLLTGEGWVFTGVEQTYAHRRFRKNRTYDSSQTPIDEEGREIILNTGPIDLADFDEHLAYPDETTDEELEKANTKRRNLELDNRKLRVRLLKSESRYEAMRRVFVEIRHLIDGLLIDTQIDAVEYADLVALRDEVAADIAAQEFGVDLNDIHGVPIAAGDVREMPVAEEKESLLGERREWRLPHRKTTYVDIEVMEAVKSHKGSVEDIAKYTGLTIKAFQNSFDRLIEEGSIVRDGDILRLGANSYARRLSEKQMVTLVRLKDVDDLDLSIINQRTLQSLSKLGLIKDAALTALGDLAVRCIEDNFILDGEALISKFPLETGKA